MKRAAVLCVLLFWLCAPLLGQELDTSPGAQTGWLPSGSYFNGDIDRINLYNGNLSLDIPLAKLAGRELSAELRFTYNSQKWQGVGSIWEYTDGIYTGGWRQSLPGLSLSIYPVGCVGSTWFVDAVWEDGLGTKHRYGHAEILSSCYIALPDGLTLDMPNLDGDGSHFHQEFIGEHPYRWIQFKDGAVLSLPYGGTGEVISLNGNVQSYAGVSTDLTYSSIGDTVNRGISCAQTTYNVLTTCTVKNANDEAQYYLLHFNHPTTSCNTDGTWCVFNPYTQAWEEPAAGKWLTSIELPNGRSYAFEYEHPQRFLTKVTLPSGAYIRYGYPYGDGVEYTPAGDRVIERLISVDGVSELSWTYALDTGSGHVVTVSSPEAMGTPTVGPVKHHFDAYGLEFETDWYDTDGTTIVKQVTTAWLYDGIEANGQPSNPHVDYVTTEIDSLKQTVGYGYSAMGSVALTTETDWYSSTAALWRKTTTEHIYPMGMYIEYERPSSLLVEACVGETCVTEQKTEFAYDEIAVTTISGTVWSLVAATWDRGNLTSIVRYSGPSETVSESFTYFNTGLVRTHTDLAGHTTEYDYTDNFSDASSTLSYAYPTTITDAAGLVTAIEYEYNTGLVTSVVNPRGKTIVNTYDSMNRPLTSATSGGGLTTTTYSDPGDPLVVRQEVKTAEGVALTAESSFDNFGRPLNTVQFDTASGLHTTTDIEYDGNGRAKRVSSPHRSGDTVVWTTTAYDALNRPLTVTTSDGTINTTRSFSYDGNTVTQTDEAGNERRLTSNGWGQLVKVEEPNPADMTPSLSTPLATLYSYYASGALKQVCQYANNSTGSCATGAQVRTFTVDWLGRTTAEWHPESGATTYTYYDNGLAHTRTDARGVQTAYTYDEIDRLLTTTYSDGTPTVTLAYDAMGDEGLLHSITDGLGATTMTYTDAGQLASEIRALTGISPSSFTTEYAYDLAGRLTQVTYPSGRVVNYTYDSDNGIAANRIATIANYVSSSTTLLNGVEDNAAGQITSQTLGGAAVVTQSYNTRNQLDGIAAVHDSTPLLNLAYGYGTTTNNGRIRSRTDSLQQEHSVSYSYDALQRLSGVSATTSNWSVGWEFDEYGNRTHQTATGMAISRVANATNVSYEDNLNTAMTYDHAGNVTHDGAVNYAYDGEGRLKWAFGGALQYGYDGLGRRVKRTYSGKTTYYFYGLTGLLSEFSTDATDSDVTAAAATDRIQYHVSEQTGTGVLVLADDGTVIENNRVFPYGESWQATAGSSNEQKFTTYDRDPASGLDYAMARFYASKTGRFVSADRAAFADPARPQSWNLYVYTMNDPVHLVDPDGHVAIPALLGLAWAAFEIGSAIYDAYNAYQTYYDSDASDVERAAAVTGAAVSIVSPGGLYGTGGKRLAKGVLEEGGSFAAKAGASSALQGARLGEHLTQLEKYGAQGFKKLENGTFRYYGNLKPATTPGEMAGARLVREWNPATGGKRTWIETLDQSGTVRSVRPETGGPKVHYIFDANGNYIGTR